MDRTDWILAGIFTFAVVAIIGFLLMLSALKCENQWEGSGMKHEFRPIGGCIVTLPDGRKIPARNYREI